MSSDYACEERLIVEIFTRLPSKSLLRFRSLSKSLYSIISSPHFIRMHTFRSPQRILLRHVFGEKSFYTLHAEDQLPLYCGYIGITPTPIDHPYIEMIGSCYGTLCFYDYVERRVVLSNPSIRRKLILSKCPLRAFNPWQFGFGFDPISDDYKIVGIYRPEDGGKKQPSFVYSVKTGTWCVIAYPTPTPISEVKSNGHFFNGVLHWMVKPHDIDCRYILTFDLSSHVFSMLSFHEPSRELSFDFDDLSYKLATVQGSLAVIVNELSTVNVDSWIWVRRDASWSIVFKVKTEDGILGALQPTNNGDILLQFGFGGAQVFNPTKIGAPSKLQNFNANSEIQNSFQYAKSLRLLDMGTAYHPNQP